MHYLCKVKRNNDNFVCVGVKGFRIRGEFTLWKIYGRKYNACLEKILVSACHGNETCLLWSTLFTVWWGEMLIFRFILHQPLKFSFMEFLWNDHKDFLCTLWAFPSHPWSCHDFSKPPNSLSPPHKPPPPTPPAPPPHLSLSLYLCGDLLWVLILVTCQRSKAKWSSELYLALP